MRHLQCHLSKLHMDLTYDVALLVPDVQVVVRSAVPASVMRYIRRCAEALGFPEPLLLGPQPSRNEGLAHVGVLTASVRQLQQQRQQQQPDAGAEVRVATAVTELRVMRRSFAINAVAHLGDYVESLGFIIHVSRFRCSGTEVASSNGGMNGEHVTCEQEK